MNVQIGKEILVNILRLRHSCQFFNTIWGALWQDRECTQNSRLVGWEPQRHKVHRREMLVYFVRPIALSL